MADPKQLEILKQDVSVWNKWRKANPDVKIDLAEANLSLTDLREADLNEAYLKGANLFLANLSNAFLSGAIFFEANLNRVNLSKAHLIGAHFIGANLKEANLSEANLSGADLVGVDLSEANLTGADLSGNDLRGANLNRADIMKAQLQGAQLSGADLSGANLSEADLTRSTIYEANLIEVKLEKSRFSKAECGKTNFGFCDLSKAFDLESVKHHGPSTVGVETFRLSRGKIPEAFLRGCGLGEWEIESARLYDPDLSYDDIIKTQYKIFDLRARPLQINNLFISYSHDDSEFVDKLESQLNNRSIRFWRDVYHATAGRMEKVIDRAMRLNPTVLLVLSKDSIQSDWVEHEVNDARKLEKELGRDVLCPVALDDEWKRPNSWSQVLMDQVKKYSILDFSQWEVDSKFNAMFDRLVDGLDLFYKK